MSIEGARTHNLKDLHLQIPLNSFVIVTGKSGSGKSSLAIDTIFAEGQRQYVESLSLYARNFFPVSHSIDVDSIVGLQPTVCIGQSRGVPNLRSTVGTLTEIYDSIRLLLAKTGNVTCPGCGKAVTPLTVQQIIAYLLSLPTQTKVMILAPIVRGRKGRHEKVFEHIRKERLVRVRIDNELVDIERLPELAAAKHHDIDAVTDRIIVRDGIETRLTESVDLAARLANGMVAISIKDTDSDGWTDKLFSTQAGCPDCQIDVPVLEPRLFSFNSPYGACESCHGIGRKISFVPERLIPDRSVSIKKGAIEVFRGRATEKRFLRGLQPVLNHLKIEQTIPLDRLAHEQWTKFLDSEDVATPGLNQVLEKFYSTCTDEDELDRLGRYRGDIPCPRCRGTRLNERANSVLLQGRTISELSSLSVVELLRFLERMRLPHDESQIAQQILPQILSRLHYLIDVGLDYLSLHRPADSLSGGELQRVRLATAIGSGLSGTCYVLDEPSAGMHQCDTERLIRALRRLQQRGNSLIVVEHDETLMREADHIVDLGPGAGRQGGQIVAQGTLEDVIHVPDSLTGEYLLKGRRMILPQRKTLPVGDGSPIIGDGPSIKLLGASGFNLKGVDAEFPLGSLICVTGVSGSGKSTLIDGTLARAVRQQLGLLSDEPLPFQKITGLAPIRKMVTVDQRPISRTSRGCAATYTGILDDIRRIFAATKMARQRGFTPSRFSFNSGSGRCSECQGLGQQKVTMRFMADISVPCTVCRGTRYNAATLSVKFRDQSIADVLNMSVEEASDHFSSFERLHAKLDSLQQVGLGYLTLGQPSTTLSGGESQRIKLSTALANRGGGDTLYLLDEPTVGLHAHDVQMMAKVLRGIVDQGSSVIVIEHNLDLVQAADWIIDMGPSGGERGGEIMVQGNLDQILKCERSQTGRVLRERIQTGPQVGKS